MKNPTFFMWSQTFEMHVDNLGALILCPAHNLDMQPGKRMEKVCMTYHVLAGSDSRGNIDKCSTSCQSIA